MRFLLSKYNLGKLAAYYVCKKIKAAKPTASKPFVLGLPTGATPSEMYKGLIALYQQKFLSFKNVVTFNMDEYVGLAEDHPQSYHHYMQHNFFKHVDIHPDSINILNGNADNLDYECNIFEAKINKLGGMDLLIGGVGEDGHIAFNEPGSSLNSATRVKTLNYNTVLANSRFFDNDFAKTPSLALTMGIKTILNAKEVLFIAKGLVKSQAVAQLIEGAITSMCPVTALQMHNKALIIADEYASYELRLKTIRYFEQLKDDYTTFENEFATVKFSE